MKEEKSTWVRILNRRINLEELIDYKLEGRAIRYYLKSRPETAFVIDLIESQLKDAKIAIKELDSTMGVKNLNPPDTNYY